MRQQMKPDTGNCGEDEVRTRDPHLGKVVFYH